MKRIFLAALLLPALAFAELNPAPGLADARVRVVEYNPSEVVRLTTFYGVSTHVQFGEGETIKDIAMGDELGWGIQRRGNYFFIKPKALLPDTNATVITDKHVYHFALVLEPKSAKDAKAWRDPSLVFSLSFKYPEEQARLVAALALAQEAQAQSASRSEQIVTKLNTARNRNENNDYWVAGSLEVSPTGARDDGRFIYLAFSNNRDMPAVYSVNEAGAEALIPTHVEGNEIVVQRLVRKLTLRKGPAVACVVNKAFDLDGGKDNTTGTVSPDVKRVLKGGQR